MDIKELLQDKDSIMLSYGEGLRSNIIVDAVGMQHLINLGVSAYKSRSKSLGFPIDDANFNTTQYPLWKKAEADAIADAVEALQGGVIPSSSVCKTAKESKLAGIIVDKVRIPEHTDTEKQEHEKAVKAIEDRMSREKDSFMLSLMQDKLDGMRKSFDFPRNSVLAALSAFQAKVS